MQRRAPLIGFVYVLLTGSIPVAAQPTPLTLAGYVYQADGVTQVPAGTPVIIYNVDTDTRVDIVTGGPPPTPGRYVTTLDGESHHGGDTVIVSSYTLTHEGSTTAVLAEPPSTTTADVVLDQLRPDAVPAASEWGLIALALLLLVAGSASVKRARAT